MPKFIYSFQIATLILLYFVSAAATNGNKFKRLKKTLIHEKATTPFILVTKDAQIAKCSSVTYSLCGCYDELERLISLHTYCLCHQKLFSSWFQFDMSRQRAEHMLKQDAKEGSFVVRKSTQPSVIYSLSVFSRCGK